MQVRFLTEPGDVTTHWPTVAPLLARVPEEAAHGEFTLSDIKALALERRMTLGIVEDDGVPVLAVAFEFRHYPRYTACNITAIGGSRLHAALGQFMPQFSAWAGFAGAREIEASCSPAIARMLSRYGFTETYRQVRLAVEENTQC